MPLIKKTLKYILKILIALSIFLLCIGAGIGIFSYHYYTIGYESIDPNIKNTLFASNTGSIILTDSGSDRRTGNTFMSIPEWYIVSISDDYTTWLESGQSPSDFPYWQYLEDYWIMYGKITAIMDGTIPRDSEYHTMVQVIGVSTTLEFGLKSFYESTIGRMTAWSRYDTDEDQYYHAISRKYVDFILLRPWYEFDFGAALSDFQCHLSGLRSLERCMIYSFELSLKKSYAKIIENAAKEAYAVPDIWTSIGGNFSSNVIQIDPKNIILTNTGINVSRYYPFTILLPKILENPDTQITTIAGNTRIMIEGIIDDGSNIQSLLDLPIPIDPSKKRTFFYTSIPELKNTLQSSSIHITHIYDF